MKTQDELHEAGEPCNEDDCHRCCGEFVGHEFDVNEGGECNLCGKNGYER